MTNELIEKYVAPRQVGEKEIKIFFKQRSTITGIFIKGADYDELDGAEKLYRKVR